MNHGCAIMKNNLRTIFDESMGGKPRKQPAVSRPVKTSLRPLFLVLFLLTVLSGLAVCVWCRGHMMHGTSIMPGWFWSSIRSPELLYSWQYDTGHNFCKRPFFSSTVIQRTSSLSTEKSFPDVWSKLLSDVFISVFTGGKIMLHAEFFFDETVDCRDGFRRRFFRGKREIRERVTYLLELI